MNQTITTPNMTGAFSRLKEQCEDRPAFERVERLERRYEELASEHERHLYRLEGALSDGNLPFIKEMVEETLKEVGRQDCPNFA